MSSKFHHLNHLSAFLLILAAVSGSAAESKEKLFRPKVGEFPPMAKAHSYKGELTFVDHANRRGSIRIDGEGRFRRTAPHT